jgi:NAD(P)H dehydrogenase (quinone)
VRILVIYAHPDDSSFHAAIHGRVVAALRHAGHEVDDCDLYAESFDPVLSREERRTYGHTSADTSSVRRHVDRLRRAEGLVFVFPTWYYGMPAILKGYIDRVWLPGVAFEVVDGRPRPLLGHIERFAVVTTYGASRWINRWLVGDPNRSTFMRGLSRLVSPNAKRIWLPLFGLDYVDAHIRDAFLRRVEAEMNRL